MKRPPVIVPNCQHCGRRFTDRYLAGHEALCGDPDARFVILAVGAARGSDYYILDGFDQCLEVARYQAGTHGWPDEKARALAEAECRRLNAVAA